MTNIQHERQDKKLLVIDCLQLKDNITDNVFYILFKQLIQQKGT